MNTVAEKLADFAVGLRYEDLPPEVVDKAKHCILDQIGVELRGATLPGVGPVYRRVRAMGGSPESTIVYHGGKTTAPNAAYVNASFGHSCEFDDAGWGLGHPGVATIPAALALGEQQKVTGKQFIAAIVAGYEVMPRLSGPIFRRLMERGWHPMSVVGVFGSTATALKLLQLDKKQAAQAFAIAASHACGTTEYDQSGGEVKRLHASLAARGGVESALLAREGFSGPPTALDGLRGFLRMFGDGEAADLRDYWGKRFYILSTLFKLYPAVGTVHGPLNILYRLKGEHNFGPNDIDRITVWLADWAVSHCGVIYRPDNALAAQFSLAFSLALCLIKGSNDLDLYMEPRLWRDPKILALADRVKCEVMKVGKEDEEQAAKMEVRLKNGRTIAGEQKFYRGNPRNPASLEELEAKFRALGCAVLPKTRVEKLRKQIGVLDQQDDLSGFWKLLVKP